MALTDKEILVKLTTQFEAMNDTLRNLDKDIKAILHSIETHNTNFELLKKDVVIIETNFERFREENKITHKDFDKRMKEVESRQQWLVAKIGSITSVIATVAAWFFSK